MIKAPKLGKTVRLLAHLTRALVGVVVKSVCSHFQILVGFMVKGLPPPTVLLLCVSQSFLVICCCDAKWSRSIDSETAGSKASSRRVNGWSGAQVGTSVPSPGACCARAAHHPHRPQSGSHHHTRLPMGCEPLIPPHYYATLYLPSVCVVAESAWFLIVTPQSFSTKTRVAFSLALFLTSAATNLVGST